MGGKITLAIRRRFGYNSRVSSAGVMELVDVADLKSAANKKAYGFDSRPGHH